MVSASYNNITDIFILSMKYHACLVVTKLLTETNHPQPMHIQRLTPSSTPIILTAFGAPSFGGGASFETLDFSLPSYNEAVKGSSEGRDSAMVESPPAGPPSFTATFAEPVDSAPPSSVAKSKEIEEKAAQDNEARLAAEEKKKAELQAKRALEKQKQL